MHPGPVNRGVELAAEAIDSPQALITQQVESGVVVRMAVLFEVLAGRTSRSPKRARIARARSDRRCGMNSVPEPRMRPPRLDARRRQAGRRADPRRQGDRPARRDRRQPRPADPRRRDRRDRRAGLAQGARRRRGRSTPRACTPSPPSSTRTCTCARRAARTRRTSTPARARPPPAASARSSRCRTPTRSSTRPRSCSRCRTAPRRGARAGRLHRLDHARHGRRGPDRDVGAGRGRRRRVHRRRPAGAPRRA